MLDTLLSYIAPHSCYICGEVGVSLCQHCRLDISFDPLATCLVCEKPANKSNLCSLCKPGSGVEDAWVVSMREGGLKRAVDAYKFERVQEVGRLSALLFHELLPLLPNNVVVTAVPTVASHWRRRGYDHTALIARHFALLRKLEYKPLLSMTGDTTQHFMSKSERAANIKGRMSCIATAPPSILLIDDIFTTGSTLKEAVRAARAGGAQTIYVAIVLRQPSTSSPTSDKIA